MPQTTNNEDASSVEPSGSVALGRGVKLIGETILPGASQLIDGNLASGGLHLIGGLAARWLFGPIGWFLVAANSYSKSVSQKNLHEHLSGQG